MRGDKTFSLLGSAQHVPQLQQEKWSGSATYLEAKQSNWIGPKTSFHETFLQSRSFRLLGYSLFGANFSEWEAWKQPTKTTAQLTKCIETAPLVEQHHTCVVVVICAYTHKVNNSYLRFHESFKTSASAQQTTVNSDNWNRKTRKLNQKERQTFVFVQ